MNIVKMAEEFATAAHGSINQVRKYTGEPYINHCRNVAYLTSLAHFEDKNLIAAAWLHDVLEDVAPKNSEFNRDKMLKTFGIVVTDLVDQVTDVSKPADGNREIRKKIDRDHLAKSSYRGATIKLADLIDNTVSISQHDVNFAKIYLAEKELLLPLLEHGNRSLLILATNVLEESKISLLEKKCC